MKKYENILLAVELEPKADETPVQQARDIASQFGAKLTLIHAVEHLSSYGAAYGVAAGVDIEEILVSNAKEELAKIGAALNVPKEQQLVKVGPAKVLILEQAKEMGADLIIVGSHGRHGIRLLLGSTANAVLHCAECDVLAVRCRG
ncbi:MAG TPA: universal stress protein [Gammaproteobacteria bacterium]|nr:universal stress protein [Gammaproteobacteria bacterium]